MELRDYLGVVWRRKWIIVATTVVTLIVVVASTLLVTPSYQATATVRVKTASEGSIDYVTYDINYGDRLMNTYAKIITSAPMLEQVRQKLGFDTIPHTSAEVVANTELIRISVEDQDPVLTEKAANALAEVFIAYTTGPSGGSPAGQQILGEQLAQYENEIGLARKQYDSLMAQSPSDPVRVAAADETLRLKEETFATLLRERARETLRANSLSVVEPAIVPASPSSPRKELNIALGLLVGLVGGFGLAFLMDNSGASTSRTSQFDKDTLSEQSM
ncbi:MAG: Wzz/FepE/Etk N-terminal domain-containing protein [Chloroflexi bacterium]|nr:Wzz/FepE/Etk N-terminal domain-containing protein [Chloroflexota bacterium]